MSFAHLGLNAVFLEPGMGGLEIYVRNLVPELLAARPDLRITVFANKAGADYLSADPWAADVGLTTHPLLGRRYTRAVSEGVILDRLAAGAEIDVLHSVAMTGPLRPRLPHVVTVGDLIWLYHSHRSDWKTTATWRLVVPKVAKRASRVITFSDFSRRDLEAQFGLDRDRIDVVPLGFGQAAAAEPTPPDELRRRLQLDSSRVLLTVSAKKPHKNLARLIEAVATVRERVPDVVLVMPGKPTAYEEELKRLAHARGLEDAVRFPAYLAAADLEGLYRLADCFVFPSLREGFGLPILEAMQRGLPVACADASALPEVAGDAALYFDPQEPAAIADAVTALLTQPELARRLAVAGRRRQQSFTWRLCAERTLTSYDRAWAGR